MPDTNAWTEAAYLGVQAGNTFTGDTHTWYAWDKQGREIAEADVNSFLDIADTGLVKLSWIRHATQQADIVVNVPDGCQPVLLRRRILVVNPNDGSQMHATVHCMGWKRPITPPGDCDCQEVQYQGTFAFLFYDGSILLTDDYQAV